MKGENFIIVLCCLQCTFAIPRGPFYLGEPDGLQPWVTGLKLPDDLVKANQCVLTIREPKKVTGHCIALGSGGTKGCFSGDTIIPFHPDC